MNWLTDAMPWWLWGIPAAGVVFLVWKFFGLRASLAALGGMALAMFGARQQQAGQRKAQEKRQKEETQAYIDTRKRIDEADIVGDDPAVARDWLRERAKGKPDRTM